MTLTELMRRMEQTGSRLSDLEGKVEIIRSRLRFWRTAALVAIPVAIALFFAWRGAHRRLEQCEKRNRNAA